MSAASFQGGPVKGCPTEALDRMLLNDTTMWLSCHTQDLTWVSPARRSSLYGTPEMRALLHTCPPIRLKPALERGHPSAIFMDRRGAPDSQAGLQAWRTHPSDRRLLGQRPAAARLPKRAPEGQRQM
jgi:hypothetical protein